MKKNENPVLVFAVCSILNTRLLLEFQEQMVDFKKVLDELLLSEIAQCILDKDLCWAFKPNILVCLDRPSIRISMRSPLLGDLIRRKRAPKATHWYARRSCKVTTATRKTL